MANRDLVVRVRAEIGAFKKDMDEAAAAAERAAKETERAGAQSGKGWDQSAQSAKEAGKAAGVAGKTAAEGLDKTSESAGGASKSTAELAAESQNAAKALGLQYDASGRLVDANGQVLSSAQASAHGMESFSEAVYLSNHQMEASGEVAGKATSRWENLSSTLQDNAATIQTVGTGLVVLGGAVTGLGVAALKTGIQYNTLQQTTRSALTTLTGSAEEANAQMDRLDAFASTSPFAKDVFIRAQQQLIGFGMEAEKVVPTLDAIQNAVAATGGSSQDILEIANVLAKVQSTGKITATTLNELGIRGVDAATIIGEQMGKTGDSIRADITEGSIGAEAALEALTQGMQSRFEGAAAGVKDTFDGATDRIKAAWRDLSAELAAPLVSPDGGGLLVDGLNKLADAMRQFQSLPAGVKGTIAVVTGLGGAAALAAGSLLLLAPRIVETIEAGKVLSSTFPKATGAISALGKAAGIAGAAVLGLRILNELFTSRVEVSAADTAQSILRVGEAASKSGGDLKGMDEALPSWTQGIQGAEGIQNAIRNVGQAAEDAQRPISGMNDLFTEWDTYLGGSRAADINSVTEAVAALADPSLNDRLNKNLNWFNEILGMPSDKLTLLEERFKGVGDQLGEMVRSGDAELAAQVFSELVAEFERYGMSGQDAMAFMPGYIDSLREQANEAKVAVTNQELLNWALSGVAPAAVDAANGIKQTSGALDEMKAAVGPIAESLSDILDSLFALGRESRTLSAAQDGLTDSFDKLKESIKENGKNFEGNSKAARDNRAALREVADGMERVLESQVEAGASSEELQDTMRGTYDSLMEATGGAESLVRELLGIPTGVDVDTWMSENAYKLALLTAEAIEAVPGMVDVTIAVSEDGTVGQVQEKINGVTGKTEFVWVTDDGTIETVQRGIVNIDGKEEYVFVTDDGTIVSTQKNIDAIRGKDVKITAVPETSTAEQALNHTSRNRTSLITQTVSRTIRESLVRQPTKIENMFVPRNADGGRLGKMAVGGRLGATGLGQDRILGLSSTTGTPTTWVDDHEWIVNAGSAGKYNRTLGMINSDHPAVQHLADTAQIPASSEVASYAASMGGSAVGGYGRSAGTPQGGVNQIVLQVENLTVDSTSRVREMSQALWEHAERGSRASGKINLGGPTVE